MYKVPCGLLASTYTKKHYRDFGGSRLELGRQEEFTPRRGRFRFLHEAESRGSPLPRSAGGSVGPGLRRESALGDSQSR